MDKIEQHKNNMHHFLSTITFADLHKKPQEDITYDSDDYIEKLPFDKWDLDDKHTALCDYIYAKYEFYRTEEYGTLIEKLVLAYDWKNDSTTDDCKTLLATSDRHYYNHPKGFKAVHIASNKHKKI